MTHNVCSLAVLSSTLLSIIYLSIYAQLLDDFKASRREMISDNMKESGGAWNLNRDVYSQVAD